MNGINLGGWLVLERWMTPSLFDGMDARNEFELSRTKEGRRRIRKHHETFITKNDLEWLKEQGIEILRVPVGYWVLGGDDRYVAAVDRLDWLMTTSLSLGLQVLLDLHAAPEAQNRAEHSGSGNTMSDKHSTKWLNNASAQDKTIEVLSELASRYAHFPHVWGIQALNEPSVDLFGLKLVRFYRNAYKRFVKVARPGTRFVFSDGYAPLRTSNCFWLLRKKDYPTVLDCHIYQVFGASNKKKSFSQHVARPKRTRLFLRYLRWQQPIIVGEWSAMLPIRTSAEQTKHYAQAQLKAFAPAEAQFYWNYKTEAEGRWNYRDQYDKGLLQ